MKNVDMEIYNYVKERLNKEVSVSFESINILEYDAILIQIIIKSEEKRYLYIMIMSMSSH